MQGLYESPKAYIYVTQDQYEWVNSQYEAYMSGLGFDARWGVGRRRFSLFCKQWRFCLFSAYFSVLERARCRRLNASYFVSKK